MFETLKEMYNAGRITEAGLKKAVKFGWITEEQMNEIIGFKEA